MQSKRSFKFKQFRKELNLNTKEFSEYFGIPFRTVQEWNQGRRKPTDYMLSILKRLYNAEK
ncbi:MAG: transcriptional regulator [Bacilli bacterium]|nr:transcriptional regulator [Bacilli bacterium]